MVVVSRSSPRVELVESIALPLVLSSRFLSTVPLSSEFSSLSLLFALSSTLRRIFLACCLAVSQPQSRGKPHLLRLCSPLLRHSRVSPTPLSFLTRSRWWFLPSFCSRCWYWCSCSCFLLLCLLLLILFLLSSSQSFRYLSRPPRRLVSSPVAATRALSSKPCFYQLRRACSYSSSSFAEEEHRHRHHHSRGLSYRSPSSSTLLL
mmetsp:Transcript_551/g.1740  ORF Transcript_551/g.1740 Transcript_551/m.1740 type:complete len:205 (-) Transcript_551:331-945(-)